MKNHEQSGLLSPYLMRKRLAHVVGAVPVGASVVDLGCGAGYLGEALSEQDGHYWGVDRIEPKEPRVDSSRILVQDLFAKDAFDKIESQIGHKVDVVTVVAFVEHIQDVASFLKRTSKLLTEGGVIVGTTPHPIGRKLHDFLAMLRICSPEAADEHEIFLDKQELEQVGISAGLQLKHYRRFLFGLNQIFVFELAS